MTNYFISEVHTVQSSNKRYDSEQDEGREWIDDHHHKKKQTQTIRESEQKGA